MATSFNSSLPLMAQSVGAMHRVACPSSSRPHSALSFVLALNGTLPATVEPTDDTPPATDDTPPATPFTRPTLIEGTEVTADLVYSRLFPPSQATPPTVAPTTVLLARNRPPPTRQIMPGWATGCSLPASFPSSMREREGERWVLEQTQNNFRKT